MRCRILAEIDAYSKTNILSVIVTSTEQKVSPTEYAGLVGLHLRHKALL